MKGRNKMNNSKIANPIIIKCTCPMCKTDAFICVDAFDYGDWQNGKHAQDAFPYLSANEREMLISGICPDCWDKMFGGNDDE